MLCLFHPDTEETLEELVMPAKTGDVWHVSVKGVEAGQLAFVALLVLLNRMVGETLRFRVPRFEPAVGYALGGLAMLWLFDRLPAVWGA